MLTRSLIRFKPLVRHQVRYSSALPTLISYIKDKGTEIPFAKKFLEPDEFERYTLYTKVKKGDYKWLKDHIQSNPLQKEEKVTMIKYIEGLKEQPYSVPNLAIGYISSWFGINTIYFSINGMLVPLVSSPVLNQYFLPFLTNLTTTGILVLDCVGAYTIYYGLKIVANELRSPYYHYDEMIRICNESVDLRTDSKVDLKADLKVDLKADLKADLKDDSK